MSVHGLPQMHLGRLPLPAQLRRILAGLRRHLLWLLTAIVPTSDNQWAFVIHPGQRWTGNLRALADECLRTTDIHIVVLDRDGRNSPGTDSEACARVKWCRRPGLAFLRCAIICTSHGPYLPKQLASSRRKQYLVWHGIGFKNHRSAWVGQAPKLFAGAIAASDVDRQRMMTKFGLPPEKVWVTGYPRTEHIIAQNTQLPPDLAAEEEMLASVLAGRELVLVAPTWEPIVDQRLSLDNIFSALDDELPEGVTFGLRLHPNAQKSLDPSTLTKWLMLDSTQFSSTEIVLRQTSLLLTDFSSIWVDFLLLQRPIVGIGDYIEHYVATGRISRDFASAFPGEWCSSSRDLRNYLTFWRDGNTPTWNHSATLRTYHVNESNSPRAALRAIAGDAGVILSDPN